MPRLSAAARARVERIAVLRSTRAGYRDLATHLRRDGDAHLALAFRDSGTADLHAQRAAVSYDAAELARDRANFTALELALLTGPSALELAA